MILELDQEVVTMLLTDSQQLSQAVERAKQSFLQAYFTDTTCCLNKASQTNAQECIETSVSFKQANFEINQCECYKNSKTTLRCNNCEIQRKEEEFGSIIFERAVSLHNEHAPELTGN